MMSHPLPEHGYGVEIRVPTVHKECESLGEVLDLLDGQAGVVRVFDRRSQTMLVDGAINEARDTLGALALESNLATGRAVPVGCPGAESARSAELERASESGDPRGFRVEVSGALNIASAYYFGDLGSVARRRGGNGEERFFRPMITRMRTAG